MFNIRLKLREPNGFVRPKGPSFFWARCIRTNIEGTKLEIKLPKHNPGFKEQGSELPDKNYQLSQLHFRSFYDKDKSEFGLVDHFREADLVFNCWAFFGPWFTGVFSQLTLFLRVVKIIDYPEGVSLFHPRAFEQVIADHLSDKYARHEDYVEGGQAFHGPYEWKCIGEQAVDGVRFVIKPVSHSVTDTTPRYHCYFPIAKDLMVTMLFEPSRLRPLPRAELDKMVAEQPMLDLMEKIIDSFSITLSPEAHAQRDAALEGLSDASLVKDFPMMKWDDLSPEESARYIEQSK